MTDYKLNICCDQMKQEFDVSVISLCPPDALFVSIRGAVGIDFCPWCGKHISFKKVGDDE